jgi:hypothetical protein
MKELKPISLLNLIPEFLNVLATKALPEGRHCDHFEYNSVCKGLTEDFS